MLKCLGWFFLNYPRLPLASPADSVQGFKERVKMIPPTEEKGEEVLASEFSPFVPCLNGCIGASPVGAKGMDASTAAGSDLWATTFCPESMGHDDRKMKHPDGPPGD